MNDYFMFISAEKATGRSAGRGRCFEQLVIQLEGEARTNAGGHARDPHCEALLRSVSDSLPFGLRTGRGALDRWRR